MLPGCYEWFEHDVLDPAGDGPMMPTHPKPAAEQYEGLAAVAAPKVEATVTW